MNLNNITKRNKPDTKGQTAYDSTKVWYLEQANSKTQESDVTVATSQGVQAREDRGTEGLMIQAQTDHSLRLQCLVAAGISQA